APVAEQRLARGQSRRCPQGAEPRLRPVRKPVRPDQQDDLHPCERRHGHPPHAQPGQFREDPDAMLVMSLEDYDEVTGKAAKAAIMTKDVVGKTPPITHVKSAEEGLLG